MARIFIDGFETGDARLWDNPSNLFLSSSNPCTGTYYATANGTILKTIPDTAALHCSIKYYEYYGNIDWFKFYNGTTLLGRLYVGSDKKTLSAYSGDGSLLGSVVIPFTAWHLVEFKFVPSTTGTGVFQVKVGGILGIDYSGPTSTVDSPVNKMNIGPIYMDDIVFDDADWIGDARIYPIKVLGADSAQWTPSAGNNYACVDEVPAVETDYVSAQSADLVDFYTATDLPANVVDVKAFQLSALTKWQGETAVSSIQLGLKTGGNPYFSDSLQAYPVSSNRVKNMWETNPDTGLPWTVSEINALSIGIKSRP